MMSISEAVLHLREQFMEHSIEMIITMLVIMTVFITVCVAFIQAIVRIEGKKIGVILYVILCGVVLGIFYLMVNLDYHEQERKTEIGLKIVEEMVNNTGEVDVEVLKFNEKTSIYDVRVGDEIYEVTYVEGDDKKSSYIKYSNVGKKVKVSGEENEK